MTTGEVTADEPIAAPMTTAQPYLNPEPRKEHLRPLYRDPNWADKPIGRDTHLTPRDRFPKTFAWMLRWTQYAELLLCAANTGLSERNQTGANERKLEQIGSPERLLYRDLEPPPGLSSPDLGRLILNECVIPALDEAYSLYADPASRHTDMERRAVLSWYHLIRNLKGSWQDKLIEDLRLPAKSDLKTLSAARWQEGLLIPETYPAGAGPALEALTAILDRYFDHLKRRGSNPEAEVDPIRLLLPSALADKWLDGEARLQDFRNKHLDEPSILDGIRPSGRLEITEQLLSPLMRQLGRKDGTSNILIQGPTSSGKSYAGRLIAAAWAKLNRRAIVLLPIKALVTQAVTEWEEFLDETDLKQKWKIVPGSRDYPQYDEDLVRGNYNIAVMIPEKLNALLARGMRLENIGVIIIDELQMVSTESRRGPALEMLMTKLRLETHIPLVGLSALLDDESTHRVSRWLDIHPKSSVKAAVRPVPLVKSVRAQTGETVLGSDGRVSETPFDAGDLRSGRKKLANLSGDRARTLDLCLELLQATETDVDGVEKPLHRGVLCFVPNRDVAETFAKAASDAMQLDPRFSTVDHGENPYHGRFAPYPGRIANFEAEAGKRWSELYRIPRGQLRASVADALRSGAGYHTARLEPTMRDEIERAFKDGIIRLLFATDTLMLGVNLPADAVVISSLYTPGDPGYMRIASRDTIAQRFGRAGRLGLSARGYGVIVLPSEGSFSRERKYSFDAEDERDLAAYVKKGSTLRTLEERALTALTEPEAVFKHYVTYVQQGLRLRSGVTPDWLSRLLLEHSRRILRARTRTEVEDHVSRLYALSLRATEPDAPTVQPTQIVASLVSDELMRNREDGLRVTELGRALGRTGLPLPDSPTVSRMARELADGAGDLTLLALAMDTEQVHNSSPWVAIRPNLSLEEEGDQVRGVIKLAQYLSKTLPDSATMSFDRSKVDAYIEDDVVGVGTAADELRELIAGNILEPTLQAVNALFRACVMLLWMRGCPFDIIESAVQKTVRSEPGARANVQPYPALHASDVRALGENCSYVFDTASDLVGVRPRNLDFRKFERMSESLSTGLPFELSILARVNLRATHRERLVSLAPATRGADFTSIYSLVVANTRGFGPLRESVRTAAQEEAYRDRTFEKVEAVTILKELQAREESALANGHKLHPALYRRPIPGSSDTTFDQLLTQIVAPDSKRRLQAISRLFEYCGLNVEQCDLNQLSVSNALDPSERFTARIVDEPFTLKQAREHSSDGVLIVACAGVSLEVVVAPLLATKQSVVIEPAVLVETVAEVLALMSLDAESSEDNAELLEMDLERHYDTIQEAISSLLSSDTEPLPPVQQVVRGKGYEKAGEAVAHLLTVAPPLMTRQDMLRLIDGLRLDDTLSGPVS